MMDLWCIPDGLSWLGVIVINMIKHLDQLVQQNGHVISIKHQHHELNEQ